MPGPPPSGNYYAEFVTSNPTTGAAQDADSLPVATATHNGTDDGTFTLTVLNLDTGRYKITGTIPGGYATGDQVQVSVAATVASVAGKAVVDNFAVGATVPLVQLADAVTHGGTTAKLVLATAKIAATAAGPGLSIAGSGSGAGIKVQGGATGGGIYVAAGASAGIGLEVAAPAGHGAVYQGGGLSNAGFRVVGGPSGAGFKAQGGASGSGAQFFGDGGGNGLFVWGGNSARGLRVRAGGTGVNNVPGAVFTGCGSGAGAQIMGGNNGGPGIMVSGGSISGIGVHVTTTSGKAVVLASGDDVAFECDPGGGKPGIVPGSLGLGL